MNPLPENISTIHGRSFAMIRHARRHDLDSVRLVASESVADQVEAAAQIMSLAVTAALLAADVPEGDFERLLELAAVSLAQAEPDGI